MNNRLIIITGYSASGKTTFSKHLAANMNNDILTFRSIARKIASDTGYKYIRDFYSHEKYALELTNQYLCQKITDAFSTNNEIIYEGVISRQVVQTFKKKYRCKVVICFIDTPFSTRKSRIIQRESISNDKASHELERKDSIKRMMDIEWLFANSDIRLNGECDVEDMRRTFTHFLEEGNTDAT